MGGMLWLLAGLVAAALLYGFLAAPNLSHRKERMAGLLGIPYAHRGLHGPDAPENSLAAFRLAVERGYGIEMDVRLTRDGQLVIHHDDSLLRMCGTDGRISGMTLEQVRALRLGDTREGVPTLDEALAIVRGRVPLILEMKSEGRESKDLPCLLHRRMQTYPGPYCVESFDPRMMGWFKRHAPRTVRGQLAHDPWKIGERQPRTGYFFAAYLMLDFLSRPDFVAYDYRTDRNLSFRLVRRLFRPVLAAWTVQRQETYEKLQSQYDLQIFEGFLPPVNISRQDLAGRKGVKKQ